MSDVALDTYVGKWLAARPACQVAISFIEPGQRAAMMAMAALEQELIDAAYGVREPQVAEAKLKWWAEELAGAAASGGRHPVVRALFADPRVERIVPEQWMRPVVEALQQLDAPTAPDFARQLEAAAPFHGALAVLETAWWFGPGADAARAARMATLGHVLAATARLDQPAPHDQLGLPMARLARHGLNRDDLASDSDARRAAVREQVQDIAHAYGQAWAEPGPLSVFRGVEARIGQRVARRLPRAKEPVEALRSGLGRRGSMAALFGAWAAARDSRRP